MSVFRPLVLCAIALLGGCTGGGPRPPAAARPAAAAPQPATNPSGPVVRGFGFVSGQCSGCHAVQPGEDPPNPQAPSFVAVANEMGFTESTLREFLVDGHDTPNEMTIQLEDEQADIVAAYIMSLRKPADGAQSR